MRENTRHAEPVQGLLQRKLRHPDPADRENVPRQQEDAQAPDDQPARIILWDAA